MDSQAPKDAELRLLRQLVDEAKTAEPPEIAWDDVEQRLLARIAADERARAVQRKAGPRWGAVAGFAAAAAAIVLGIADISGSHHDALAPEPVAATVDLASLPTHDGAFAVDGMRRGTVVESGSDTLRFSLPGVAEWSLAPASRAIIDTVSVPHVVRLEQGHLHAEVVPVADSNQLVESFVVEVGTTRVAVHGTSFDVVRQDDQVLVDVSHGSVSVGPAGHRGATTGRLLIGPARATFGLDAGRLISGPIAREEPIASLAPSPAATAVAMSEPPHGHAAPTTDVAEPEETPAPTAASHPVARPAAPTNDVAEPNDPPSEGPAKISVAQAQSLMLGCLHSAASAGATDTKVTIASQVTVSLGGSGEVTSVKFSPPLRPDVQERCAGSLFGRNVEGSGKVSFPVQVTAN
ncbi:MAG: FecR domain-containing protein [Polyangiaceae bacterium]